MSDQELIEYVASKKVTAEELQTVVDITSHPISSIVGALLSSRFNIDLAVESFVLSPSSPSLHFHCPFNPTDGEGNGG